MQTSPRTASDISAALAANAEAVCRHYLPHGQRQGRYWIAGDVHGSRGHSLFVRLRRPGQPGKWNDAATGEHGDLLDIIRHQSRATDTRELLTEARTFLAIPAPAPDSGASKPESNYTDAARRLWRLCQPIAGTHAEAYLQARGIQSCRHPSLRFHPSLYYRHGTITTTYPGLVASVTDRNGQISGVARTYLDPARPAKARLPIPKKALGDIIGNTVTFTSPHANPCLVVGEGIETVLSILAAYPAAAGAATLSAAGLGSFTPPPGRRIAIARDRGEAGIHAAMRLAERCIEAGNPFRVLPPCLEDFNDDLVAFGPDGIRRQLSES